nr:glycosyltransferase [Sinorhizobium saheli]
MRSLGLKVHLVALPFEQPLGTRSFGVTWARQCRWARLRRVGFPYFSSPENFG